MAYPDDKPGQREMGYSRYLDSSPTPTQQSRYTNQRRDQKRFRSAQATGQASGPQQAISPQAKPASWRPGGLVGSTVGAVKGVVNHFRKPKAPVSTPVQSGGPATAGAASTAGSAFRSPAATPEATRPRWANPPRPSHHYTDDEVRNTPPPANAYTDDDLSPEAGMRRQGLIAKKAATPRYSNNY